MRFAGNSAAIAAFVIVSAVCGSSALAQTKSAAAGKTKTGEACCPAPTKTAKTGKRDACAVPMTLSLTGLHCAGCEGNVTKSLMAVTGVEEVSVSAKTQQAVVWVCPHKNVKPTTLTAAVKKAGYSVVKVAKGAPKPASKSVTPSAKG